MPQVIIKGMPEETVKKISPKLISEMARLLECPEDWLIIDWVPSRFFDGKGETPLYPILQVWWYERPKYLQEEVARKVSEIVLEEGYPMLQLTFHLFREENFYEFFREDSN